VEKKQEVESFEDIIQVIKISPIKRIWLKLKGKIIHMICEIESWWQRRTIGFAYEEVWDLSDHIAEYVLPRIKHLRAHGVSHPMDMTSDEWHEILDKIIWSLDMYISERYSIHQCDSDRYREGLRLFGEHWLNLWD